MKLAMIFLLFKRELSKLILIIRTVNSPNISIMVIILEKVVSLDKAREELMLHP